MDKKGFISGVVWSFGGQLAYMVVGFIGNVLLVRNLTANEYGKIGIAMFFITLASILVESGFSGALIRKVDVEEKDYSTVFIFNLVVSSVLFFLMIFFSGIIADFYNDFQLKEILIVLSSILLINSFQITQNAKLVRNMQFKKRAVYKFLALSVSTIIALIIAYSGYGLWSMVLLQVLSSLILSILLVFGEGRLKTLTFCKQSFKQMYAFGINTTLASLLNSGFENIYQLILGKYFSLAQVGFYYQAKRLQEVPDSLFKIVISNVVYSYLSKHQLDMSFFNRAYTKIMIYFSSAIGLCISLIVLYAEDIISIFYGNKWLESTFFLQVLAISSFFYVLETFNRNIFKIFDQTKKILFLEVLKKGIQLITILVGVYYKNLEYLIYGYLLTSLISYGINYFYSKHVIDNFAVTEIYAIVKICCVSFLSVLMFKNIESSFNYISLLWLFPAYIVLFYFMLVLFKVLSLKELFFLKRKFF